jgi:hypothetical protein
MTAREGVRRVAIACAAALMAAGRARAQEPVLTVDEVYALNFEQPRPAGPAPTRGTPASKR